MILVRVVYDRYNRSFKLADPEWGPVLEDGKEYFLEVPADVAEPAIAEQLESQEV